MHRDIDRHDRRQQRAERKKGPDNLSFIKRKNRRPSRQLSSNSKRNYLPSVKRKYRKVAKRYKADDLNDNGSDGSLWSGQGKYNNFLFSSDNEKKNGDIVIINVATALKNEITRELKYAFPQRVRKKDTGKKGEAETTCIFLDTEIKVISTFNV